MGMTSLAHIADVGRIFREKGYRRVSPHFLPMVLINMAAGHISLKYGLQVMLSLNAVWHSGSYSDLSPVIPGISR